MTNLPENVEKLCKWPMLWSDAQKEQAADLIRLLLEDREAEDYASKQHEDRDYLEWRRANDAWHNAHQAVEAKLKEITDGQ